MLTGINHITLSVTDLDRAIAFYTDILGAKKRAIWAKGAYLEVGTVWLCLEKADVVTPRHDDTHLAFGSDRYTEMAAKIEANAQIWKTNKSEGASVYFCDPDGHKLELHDGTLASRLDAYADSRPDVTIFAT